MKATWTASELAELRLACLPATERGVQLRAQREGWKAIKEPCKGGFRDKYLALLLPEEIRIAITMATTTPTILDDTPALSRKSYAQAPALTAAQPETALKQWQRETAEARLAIVRELERLEAQVGTNRAVGVLLELAADGRLPVHIRQLIQVANKRSGAGDGGRTLSRTTLFRWKRAAGGGIAALAPKDVEPKQVPSWAPDLLKAFRKPQNPPLSEAVAEVRMAGHDVSYAQARRWLEKVGEVEKRRGRMGSKEITNIKGFRRRDTSKLLPTDVYSADGHTYDAEVAHPDHGRPFRPEVTAIIDAATRRVVGWSVALAESSLATVDALRNACETSGVPAIFYCDNGSGYKNEMMTAPGTGFMARLSITMTHSLPYNSKARGLIERNHQTALVASARQLATNVNAAMDRDAKKIVFKHTRKDHALLPSWRDFVAVIEEAFARYNNREHRGLPKIIDPATGKRRHMTPNEMWASFMYEGWQPTKAGELPDLYHPQVSRKVARCEVNLFGHIYYSRELTEWHGMTVHVAYDVHDPKRVWIRDQDQRLICTADLDGNKSDYYPMSFVEQAREKRAAGRLRRLELKADEVHAELAGSKGEIRAIRVDHAAASPTITVDRGEIEAMHLPENVVEIPQDDRGKYRFWCSLEQRVAAGETLSGREESFFRKFQATAIFRSFREVEADLAQQ
ncbi:MAG: Mu transposase C-terminal domain-containing protein [Thermodesulfobacteriota bacterium]